MAQKRTFQKIGMAQFGYECTRPGQVYLARGGLGDLLCEQLSTPMKQRRPPAEDGRSNRLETR